MQHQDVLKILQHEFARMRQRNPLYSLRAYSRYLGVSPGSLSEILRGKRPLTERQKNALMQKLKLTIDDVPDVGEITALSIDEFKVVSSWYHFATINLFDTLHPPAGAADVAKRLGITRIQAEGALQRLCKLKLLEVEGTRYRSTGKWITTSHDVENLALRKFQSELLEKARESLVNDPLELRDITNISMAIDTDKLLMAKAEIKKFRRRMAKLLEEGKQTTVYNLSIQLFPLEKGGAVHEA